MPDQEYETRCAKEAHRREVEIDKAPLADRQAARTEFAEALKDQPGLVAERIGWLLNGTYGYGEMMNARQLLAHKRMNRRAGLVQFIAVYEWMCPRKFAVDAWKTLTPAEKTTLDVAVDGAIAAAEKELADNE